MDEDLHAAVDKVCDHLMQPVGGCPPDAATRPTKRSRHTRLWSHAEAAHQARPTGGDAMPTIGTTPPVVAPQYRQAVAQILRAYESVRSQPVSWCRTVADDSKLGILGEIYRQFWVVSESFAPGLLSPPSASAAGDRDPGHVTCATCSADMNPSGSGVCDVCSTVLYEGTMNHLVARRTLGPRLARLTWAWATGRFFFAAKKMRKGNQPTVMAHPRRRLPPWAGTCA